MQSYRSLHVTIQGLLIAAGAAVLAVQLTGATQAQAGEPVTNAVYNGMFSCLLIFIFWLQLKTAREFRGVIGSRAEDINYWHRHTLLAENSLEPRQRTFTHFKMWQHAHRAHVEHVLKGHLPDEGLSDADADELIGEGIGHTRRVLDYNLFERLLLLSKAMFITSLGISGWFAHVWLGALAK